MQNRSTRPALIAIPFAITLACGPAPTDGRNPPSDDKGGNSAGNAGASNGGSAGGGSGGSSAAGNSGGSTASNGGSSTGNSAGGAACEPSDASDGLLSDFEGGMAKLLDLGGRQGSWFLYSDGTSGGAQTPMKLENMPLAAEGPGACNSMFAFHTTGSGFDTWAGVGVNLAPKTPEGKKGGYDMSGYRAIAFRAKAAKPVLVRVALADKNSDPDGGVCTDTTDREDKTRCADHFGKDITLGAGWNDYHIAFGELAQRGFGLAVPSGPDTQNAFTLFFQARAQGGAPLSYDLWLDDVRFVK